MTIVSTRAMSHGSRSRSRIDPPRGDARPEQGEQLELPVQASLDHPVVDRGQIARHLRDEGRREQHPRPAAAVEQAGRPDQQLEGDLTRSHADPPDREPSRSPADGSGSRWISSSNATSNESVPAVASTTGVTVNSRSVSWNVPVLVVGSMAPGAAVTRASKPPPARLERVEVRTVHDVEAQGQAIVRDARVGRRERRPATGLTQRETVGEIDPCPRGRARLDEDLDALPTGSRRADRGPPGWGLTSGR